MTMDWQRAKHILCVRLDNMGDVLMTSPALHALKASSCRPKLTLWCSPSGAAVARHIDSLDSTLTFDAPWMKNDAASATDTQAMIQRLTAENFDAAVIFTVFSQSPLPAALLCHLAGIERVVAHCRENPYHLISDWVKETEPEGGIRHEVQRQIDLVGAVGFAVPKATGLSFKVFPADIRSLNRRLAYLGIGTRSLLVAHCGATAPSRRYPPAQFARALTRLANRGHRIVLTGGVGERDLVRRVVERCEADVVDLSGLLTLGELGALIQRAAVLVANNSGPVHIAAAVGTPVVDLYALTNPQHGPWRVAHRMLNREVPCAYCYKSICPQGHHACLAGVSPDDVADAVWSLLDRQPPPDASTAPGAGGEDVASDDSRVIAWRTS